MEVKYQQFLDFNWSNEKWQAYLDGLYPTPTHKQILKFKKKWYKKSVDAEFDESYEPSSSGVAADSGPSATSGPAGMPTSGDVAKWAALGSRALPCFVIYAGGMALAVASVFGIFPASKALMALAVASVFDVLSRHAFKFSKEYLQNVMMDEAGRQCLGTMALLMPGLHKSLAVVGLVPSFLMALLSVAQIAKACDRVPGFLRKAFSPMAEPSAQYPMMQVKADAEVGAGFFLIVGVFMGLSSPMSPLLYWNVMTIRYAMSAWTQASFRKIDGLLSLVLGRIPLVSTVYSKLKDFLYGFVDPARRRQASSCNIL
mmetsp:Transcript_88380/g.248996  ORF Transcript_88380/g.248996 Transcript_88380/m.248996 type:complete len:314 (+) Transcript_88380:67-1008(+)